MKFLFLSLAVLFASSARAEFIVIEGFGGLAIAHPTSLNDGIASEKWNNTAAAPGSIKNLNYYGVDAGIQIFPFVFASLRYESVSKTLGSGDAGGGKTIQDSFNYQPILLMLEASSPTLMGLVFTGGFGIGTTANFQFHEKYSGTGEDITYAAKPLVLRARGEVAYMFLPILGVAFEMMYDTISATPTAVSDYTATHNGVAIKKGDKFADNQAVANMSGLRVGLGLRFAF